MTSVILLGAIVLGLLLLLREDPDIHAMTPEECAERVEFARRFQRLRRHNRSRRWRSGR